MRLGKMLVIVALIFLFTVFYIWQNVEVMKIEMSHSKLGEKRKGLIKQNDRLLYEIEKLRTMEYAEKYAAEKLMKRMNPENFIVLDCGGGGNGE